MNHSGSKDNLAPQEGRITLAMRLLPARAAGPAGALHPYRLDADHRDKLTLRFAPLLPIPVPEAPITTLAAARHHSLDPLVEPQLQDHLLKLVWRIVEPIQRIWTGERDEAALIAGLDDADTLIVREILKQLEGN